MKKIIYPLILIIVLGMGFLGGYFVFGNKNENDTPKNKDTDLIENQDTNREEFKINYKEEEYTTKNNLGFITSTSKRNIPIITSTTSQTTATKIEQDLTNISDKEWEEDIKKTADETVEMFQDQTENKNLGVTYLFTTGVINSNRLTFLLKMDGAFGGVSWMDEKGFNYDVKTGEKLTIKSIAKDYDNLKNILYEEVKNNIEQQEYANALWNDSASGVWRELLKDLIEEDGNWYFTDTGVTFVFPKYSLGPGSVGVITVSVNKDIINPYLIDEYKVE